MTTIDRCTFEENAASLHGGGLYVNEFDRLDLDRSSFLQNSADIGAGISLYKEALGARQPVAGIRRSTLASNVANAWGGGLASRRVHEIRIENTTIHGNQASIGAGVVMESTNARFDFVSIVRNHASQECGGLRFITPFNYVWKSTLSASIVALNESLGDTPDVQILGRGLESAGYNFVGFASPASGFGKAMTDVVGIDSPIDPMLEGLADGGGPTQTVAPLPASPLIDAIPARDCATNAGALLEDQRGEPRPFGYGCEIGARELP